ncbi:hypothetical protein acdb102_08400 [Acidothermaceae bacterium B102]|nr:hypothetical protein acdb102_08400 [Acidothermaceae bacterium B102]
MVRPAVALGGRSAFEAVMTAIVVDIGPPEVTGVVGVGVRARAVTDPGGKKHPNGDSQ